MGLERAADAFSVPMITLYRRVQKKKDAEMSFKEKPGRFRNAFHAMKKKVHLQNIAY
jgi:hypothetical protein